MVDIPSGMTLQGKLLQYYCFIVDLNDIYEIKIHTKLIYCHKFETKLLLSIHNHNLGKLGRFKVHSQGSQWTLTMIDGGGLMHIRTHRCNMCQL